MKIPTTKEIFQNKFNKLNKIEENFVNAHFSKKSSEFNIERLLYSCEDGFVILRRYSLQEITNFQIINISEDVSDFLKGLPYQTKSDKKVQINLFELLRQSIGIELKMGQTIDLGSQGGGIKVGNQMEIDGFVILIRKYSDLTDIQETLLDIFKFLELSSEKINLNNKIEQLLTEVDDKNFLLEYKQLELQEKEEELEKSNENVELLSQYNSSKNNEDFKENFNIKKPFNFCVLGEESNQATIRKEIKYFFEKLGVGINDWSIEFINNAKLQNTDVLRSLNKGQSKYDLIITGQIFHHSGKSNTKANIISELKNEKYIPHIIGCSPKDKLTPDKILNSLEKYFMETN